MYLHIFAFCWASSTSVIHGTIVQVANPGQKVDSIVSSVRHWNLYIPSSVPNDLHVTIADDRCYGSHDLT